MSTAFQLTSCPAETQQRSDISYLNLETAQKVRRFHQSFPQYQPTPLANLSQTAQLLGLSQIFVKDESHRFGLNAFKVLGGSYAIGNVIAARMQVDIDAVDYAWLTADAVQQTVGALTFITATDGNHGRGVAWTATALGQKSIVYMPKGSAPARLDNIRKAGAQASITDLCYDDTVRLAREHAQAHDYILVQDTAWDDYTEVPTHIMQGYLTMALEAMMQLGDTQPTHIFLQAGVGSLPGALAGFFANVYSDHKPIIVIVEPNKADCIYRTAAASDGSLHFVTEEMDTIMAGLACGEPNPISWAVLRDYADFFLSCPDYTSAKGMRMLATPVAGDDAVVSGESGAATFGAVAEIMQNPALQSVRNILQLGEQSNVLCFSTEGATDLEHYRHIVWDGWYPAQA